MKTNILPVSAFLAALAATLTFPVGATAAAFAFTATGLLAVFTADYGRTIEPVRVPADIVPFGSPGRHAEQLCHAA